MTAAAKYVAEMTSLLPASISEQVNDDCLEKLRVNGWNTASKLQGITVVALERNGISSGDATLLVRHFNPAALASGSEPCTSGPPF